MLRSLSTAVSGLRNNQTRLDVIGNNIANVNTVSYKSTAVRFQEIFNQTMRGATAPGAERGGMNPMQIGLGMSIATIDTNHGQGAISSTGRETDLAVEGRGFFVVGSGNQQYFTRDGSFARDAAGFLVNAAGHRLMGWTLAEGAALDTSQPLGSIHIPLGEEMIASATQNIRFSGNLDARAATDDTYIHPVNVFDSLGNKHPLRFVFTKTATANAWDMEVHRFNPATDAYEEIYPLGAGPASLIFTESGQFVPPGTGGSTIPEFTFDFDAGAEDVTINFDFNAATQVAFTSNVIAREQDGFAPGEMVSFSIESTGKVAGTYSNGMTREIGQIALAAFANPQGLVKLGSNLYTVSSNSGEARIGAAGTEGRGLIQSGALEMSNVDLAQEFTDMITTSRAFQANTRMISASDEILLELINIKR